MDNNEQAEVVEKVIFTGRGSYLKNNPEAAKRLGSSGDPKKKTGRKPKKEAKRIDEETKAFLEGIDWKQKEKIEENTLELLGHLLKEANGDFDRMLSVAKEIIKLVPKKDSDAGPRVINMNFLGNMQTQADPLDKIEVAEYKVIGQGMSKEGMSKEGINKLLEDAEKIIEGINVTG